MKAELIIHNKVIDEYSNIIEIKLWKVEKSSDKPHGYKYSLVYIAGSKRVIGYDNAEQKGDHRHFGNRMEPYAFAGINQLIRDFYSDIVLYNKRQ
ncbi:MAG: DUF6516 family protein [Desulfobacterales bacterium]